jgi:hypothetical protein
MCVRVCCVCVCVYVCVMTFGHVDWVGLGASPRSVVHLGCCDMDC